MNNLKAERTLTAKSKLSDERLESLRKWYAAYPGWKHDNLSNLEIASIVAELQSLRSLSLSTQQPMGEPVAFVLARDGRTWWNEIVTDRANLSAWEEDGYEVIALYALHPKQEKEL